MGMSIVRAEDDLMPAVDLAFAEDETALIEPLIEGIELTAGVIGNRELEALPLIEIVPDDQIMRYAGHPISRGKSFHDGSPAR